MAETSWSKHVADVLRRNGIRIFATVPDYVVSHVLEDRSHDQANAMSETSNLLLEKDGPANKWAVGCVANRVAPR